MTADVAAVTKITTLAERKASEASRRKRAANAVVDELRCYARANGGRFIVFGSYVADRIRFDSDLDLEVDFPVETTGEAWRLVEEVSAERSVPADLHDARSTKAGFRHRDPKRTRKAGSASAS